METKQQPNQALWLVKEAQKQLNLGLVESTKVILASAISAFELHEQPQFQKVIDNLMFFFDDIDTTYTKIMETMSRAQCDIMRLTNELEDRRNPDDPTDLNIMRDVHDFFFKMNLLMWQLKPIAMYVERQLQDKGPDYVGY